MIYSPRQALDLLTEQRALEAMAVVIARSGTDPAWKFVLTAIAEKVQLLESALRCCDPAVRRVVEELLSGEPSLPAAPRVPDPPGPLVIH